MVLKEKLGEDGYAELMVLLKPPSANWMVWAKGAAKSWTTWFGAFLVAAPELLPQFLPQLAELLTPDAYSRATQVIGVIVLLLRVKTTTSLVDKGKA